MCSTAMAAPCIIDDGASCATLARPVATPIVGFPVFMATVGSSSVVAYAQLAFLLVAMCLNVPGVLTCGTSDVTSPFRFLVVCCGEVEQV